jgi:colicin import membrane protein
MKAKKTSPIVYFLFPILGLAIFIPFYWNFAANYDRRQEERAEAVQAEKRAALEKENQQRQKAIAEAVADEARRKAEAAAKAAAEQKREDERQASQERLARDVRESTRLQDQIDELQNDVKVAKDAIDKIEQDEKVQRQNEAFLTKYVVKAQSNVQDLTDVLQKIADADARAAAAAAAAAKKS